MNQNNALSFRSNMTSKNNHYHKLDTYDSNEDLLNKHPLFV